MKLFGSKSDDQQNESAGGNEELGDSGQETGFSAPSRLPPEETGGKKGLLLFVSLLVIAGVGGGYFYFGTMQDDIVRPVISTSLKPPLPAVPPSITLPDQALAQPAPSSVPQTLPGASSQPVQAVVTPASAAPQSQLLAQPSADVLAGEGKEVLAAPSPVTSPSVIQSGDAAVLVKAAEQVSPPPAPVALPPSSPQEKVVVAPLPPLSPAAETPAPKVAETPAIEKVLTTPVAPEKQPPAAEIAEMPDPAELAIVQNAAVLDSLSPPDATSAGVSPRAVDILNQSTSIRDLPEKYLIVRTDKSADDLDASLTAARSALSQGRNQAALELFNEVYKRDPHNKRALMGRAVSLQKLGQTEEALSAYELALNDDPKNIEALTNMLGLLKNQDQDLAVEKLQQLRAIYPANADVLAQLGMVYGVAGDYEKALKHLEMADALKPGNPNILYNRAVVYDRMGNTMQAASLYRQIILLAGDGSLEQSFPIEVVKKRLSVIR